MRISSACMTAAATLAMLLWGGFAATQTATAAGVAPTHDAINVSDISARKRVIRRRIDPEAAPPYRGGRVAAPPPYRGYYYGDPYYPYRGRPYRFYAPAPIGPEPLEWW